MRSPFYRGRHAKRIHLEKYGPYILCGLIGFGVCEILGYLWITCVI